MIEVARPELRMDSSALEGPDVGYYATQGFFVVVVPGTKNDEACVKAGTLAFFVYLQAPGLLVRGPVSRDEPRMKLYITADSVQGSGLRNVLSDGLAIKNGFLPCPWSPGEAEGIKIRVRAEAWVAEEIPSTSNTSSRFNDHVFC